MLLVASLSMWQSRFNQSQSMWDLWWTKWHKSRFFSEYFGFHMSVWSHQGCIFIPSSTWVLWQLIRYSKSLRARWSGNWIPVVVRFSAPVQTSPEAHLTSYTMGTDSFLGVKQPGNGMDHTPPSSVEVKERVGLYLYSPSGLSWPVLGWILTFTFYMGAV
jgi:hypothetical protein